MIVWVAHNRWVGIFKCCMTRQGMMLNADPGSTWMRLTSDDLIYPVKYRGLSCFPLTCMSSGVKVIQGACWEAWRQFSSSSPVVQPESGPWRPQHQLKLLSELLLLTLIVLGAHKGWSWPRCWPVELRHQSGKVLKIFPLCPLGELWNIEALLLLHGLLHGGLGWLWCRFRRIFH